MKKIMLGLATLLLITTGCKSSAKVLDETLMKIDDNQYNYNYKKETDNLITQASFDVESKEYTVEQTLKTEVLTTELEVKLEYTTLTTDDKVDEDKIKYTYTKGDSKGLVIASVFAGDEFKIAGGDLKNKIEEPLVRINDYQSDEYLKEEDTERVAPKATNGKNTVIYTYEDTGDEGIFETKTTINKDGSGYVEERPEVGNPTIIEVNIDLEQE